MHLQASMPSQGYPPMFCYRLSLLYFCLLCTVYRIFKPHFYKGIHVSLDPAGGELIPKISETCRGNFRVEYIPGTVGKCTPVSAG